MRAPSGSQPDALVARRSASRDGPDRPRPHQWLGAGQDEDAVLSSEPERVGHHDIDGRIAWSNPGGIRKHHLPEGAGIQFTNCDNPRLDQLQDYVYELVEDTLSRAHLI